MTIRLHSPLFYDKEIVIMDKLELIKVIGCEALTLIICIALIRIICILREKSHTYYQNLKSMKIDKKKDWLSWYLANQEDIESGELEKYQNTKCISYAAIMTLIIGIITFISVGQYYYNRIL